LEEHFGSFLAGKKRLEKKRRLFFWSRPLECGGSESGPTWGEARFKIASTLKIICRYSGFGMASCKSSEQRGRESLRTQRFGWLASVAVGEGDPLKFQWFGLAHCK